MGPKNSPPDSPVRPEGDCQDEADFAARLLSVEQRLVSSADAEVAKSTPPTDDARLRRAQSMLARLIACGDAGDRACSSSPDDPEATSWLRLWLDPQQSAAAGKPQTLGRFEIIRELGQGGGGVVLLAADPVLKRQVALKLPRPEFFTSASLRGRFRREGEAVARLTHPNIVALYEVGEVGPIVFLCTAYTPGLSLAEWLSRRGAIDARDAAALVATLAEAMAYAHAHGVVHRDLKPANVLLEQPPEAGDGQTLALREYTPKIVDFGLAKLVDEAGDESRTGQVLGTPAYMAPEQAAGGAERNSPLVDVYGLGAVLYELLAGRAPFGGTSYIDTLRQAASDEPPALSRLGRRVPADLEAICFKCLEKNPRRRYVSTAALADDLRRWLRDEPVAAKPLSVAGKAVRWARRRPSAAALAAVSVCALLTIMTVVGFYTVRLQHAVDLAEQQRSEADHQRTVAHQRLVESESRERQLRQRQYENDVKTAYREWQDGRVNEAAELVEPYSEIGPGDDLRTYEWYYLQQLLADRGAMLEGHEGAAYYAEFSPDGTRIVSGGQDGTVRLWDVETSSLLRTFAGHEDEVNWVAFSPDGRWIASASDDGTLRLWSADEDRPSRILQRVDLPMRAACFTPDGQYLAAAYNGSGITIFSCQDWSIASSAPFEAPIVHNLDVSPDSRRLVVGGGERLAVYPLPGVGQGPVMEKAAKGRSFAATGISPDGQSLAYYDGRLEIASFGQQLDPSEFWVALGHDAESFCWSRDGQRLIVPEGGGVIGVYDVATQVVVQRVRGHQARIWCVRLSPDGDQYVTAGDDGKLFVWPVDLPQGYRLLAWGTPGARPALAFRKEGSELAWCDIAEVKCYRFDTGAIAPLLKVHPALHWNASLASEGESYVSWRADTMQTYWHDDKDCLALGKYDNSATDRFTTFGNPAISSDGRLIYLTLGETPDVLHLATVLRRPGFETVLALPLDSRGVQATFSRDSRWIALCDSSHRLRLFDSHSGRQLADVKGASGLFLDDRGEMAVNQFSRVEIVTLPDLTTCRLLIPVGEIKCLAATPDGKTLAVGTSRGAIHFFSLQDGAETLVLQVAGQAVAELAFSPDSRLLASASFDDRGRQEIRLWPGRPLEHVPPATDEVWTGEEIRRGRRGPTPP